MIMINETKIEKTLKEVITYIYGKDPACYLVLESIKVFTENEQDNKDYCITLEGRYGREGEAEFNRRFDVMIQSTWSYDFIKGYFFGIVNDIVWEG